MYICDFHREQAWVRWLKMTKHNLGSTQDEVLAKMRRIASASTQADYDNAVENLKSTKVWEENEAFQSWFSIQWLRNAKVYRIIVKSVRIIVFYHYFQRFILTLMWANYINGVRKYTLQMYTLHSLQTFEYAHVH